MSSRKATLLGTAIALGALGLSASSSHAAYTVVFQQVGGNVVATGSGSINTSALTPAGGESDTGFINASMGRVGVGPISPTSVQTWTGITGPASFGPGGAFNASSGSGFEVEIAGSPGIIAPLPSIEFPSSYVSGTFFTDTATWQGETFTGLGLTPGTYVYTWGSGATADSFTVTTSVPEPASLSMIALAAGGLLKRRKPQR